ncbi:hypothetical protein E4T44_06432 [Aureobasidium sp. EXF-8845]|nr:hypothetical protein E4T44_06432 [Aureobasidium sp. EXF-8845]KAI4848307.1 hypothetical protein E4T45_06397 [Aureobasidium sp. EXF-8846]
MSTFSWRPPSVPFEAQTRDGQPFTVWHVCSVCQQPRSARYHSEHPVDSNSPVLPPPSICRRCASKSSSLPLTLALPSTHIFAPQNPTPQVPTPPIPPSEISTPQPPTSPSPSPQPESRYIPFRYVKPFAPEPQHIGPPPAPALPVEPTVSSIEIMPLRGPSYEEYRFVQRENARKSSSTTSRDYYPPSARDYPPPSRDYPTPAREPYAAPRQDYSVAKDYTPPLQESSAPYRDYPAPVRENPAYLRDRPSPFHDYPSTLSSRPGSIRGPLPYKDRPAPLTNVKSTKRRVSFSGEDEVAALPPDLPSGRDDRSTQGLSRMRLQPPNISGMPTVHDNYEYDKQRNRTYIDPAERPYVPEPKWTPLSESPARELPLVEESYAHGPYRAENSPTPSMQVHVDRDDFVLDKGGEPRKTPRQYEPQASQQNDRAWTRYVTVKEHRDEKGPFVEVEEKFVFDDER